MMVHFSSEKAKAEAAALAAQKELKEVQGRWSMEVLRTQELEAKLEQLKSTERQVQSSLALSGFSTRKFFFIAEEQIREVGEQLVETSMVGG
jgi:hypothetical protein